MSRLQQTYGYPYGVRVEITVESESPLNDEQLVGYRLLEDAAQTYLDSKPAEVVLHDHLNGLYQTAASLRSLVNVLGDFALDQGIDFGGMLDAGEITSQQYEELKALGLTHD
jgi:hypothetical protein